MALPSYRQRNAELLSPDAVARVLRGGSVHLASKPDAARAAQHLASLGLIDTRVSEYVQCVNHKDRDYTYVRNRSCRGRIRIEENFEDGDSLECPECGRTVYPRGKARHRVMQVRVKPKGVAAFLENRLDEKDYEWKQVRPWVWRVDMPEAEVKVVAVDYCNAECVAREWAASNRACYVVVDAARCGQRFLPDHWLTWAPLADIVCRPAALPELISSAATMDASSQVRASVPVYSATVRPVVLDGKPAEQTTPAEPEPKAMRARPDPLEHTVAKVWTTQDGTFCLSTKTKAQRDGECRFPLWNGEATKQMRLMMVLCHKHPAEVRLATVIEQVYPESKAEVLQNPNGLLGLLKKVRSLVSDIRNKKLAPAGINSDILPPLDMEITADTAIGLKLAHVHRLDEVGFGEQDRDLPA